MKKIMGLLIVLMLMASISSLALADDAEENEQEEEELVDEQTENEIEIMNYSLGAEIRILQLEKSLMKNILIGERVIEILQALDYNTTDLEYIIEEMQFLLEEVQNANTTSNESVQIFIDLKTDAKNLTKEYRDTVKDLLDHDTLKEVRERIREMAVDNLENYSKQIRNRIKQFNRNQIHRLFGIIGESNESFYDDYMNGNLTVEEIKNQISKMVNQRVKEKKNLIISEIIEGKIKNQVQAKAYADNASKNFEERMLERLQNRLQKAEDKGNNKLMEKIQNKINNMNGGKGHGGNSDDSGQGDNSNNDDGDSGNSDNGNGSGGNSGKGSGKGG